jgi:hypothetical protein
MPKNPNVKRRGGALVIAFGLATAMFGATTWPKIVTLAILMAACLLYGLSGWATKAGLTIPEKMGRSLFLVLGVGTVVSFYAWWFRPGWHLTGEQEDTIVEIAKHIPKSVAVVIELPETSWQGQEYGREIMRLFKENGVTVNSITVFHAAETPPGLVVFARREGDLGYDIASYAQYKMILVKMPARFESDPASIIVGPTSFMIYVGSRPTDD